MFARLSGREQVMFAAVCLRWMPSWTLGTMVGSAQTPLGQPFAFFLPEPPWPPLSLLSLRHAQRLASTRAPKVVLTQLLELLTSFELLLASCLYASFRLLCWWFQVPAAAFCSQTHKSALPPDEAIPCPCSTGPQSAWPQAYHLPSNLNFSSGCL